MAANDSARGRRESVGVRVGAIRIGGGAPVVVQSMTNTDTADARATAEQVKALADAGSEIVRITVDTPKAAAAVPTIRERLEAAGCHVPLVGDFHYNGHWLLTEYPACAEALDKYRINPGSNVAPVKTRPGRQLEIIRTLRRNRNLWVSGLGQYLQSGVAGGGRRELALSGEGDRPRFGVRRGFVAGGSRCPFPRGR